MKRTKQILAVLVSLVLALGAAPLALAEAGVPKEEVVYVNLNPDGSVEELYVVNAFTLEEPTVLTDYGDYESVRNLTTTDALTLANGVVRAQLPAGRFYYQGNLAARPLPWKIAIEYLLNGQPIRAAELAGRSGQLEIRLSIAKDPDCPGDFFDQYALQLTLALDAEKCTGITADGATIVGVGGDKQLTYTLLAGTEKQFSVQCTVRDFSMAGIQINGIPLSLDIDAPDISEFTSRVQALQDAIGELDDGSGKLRDGVKDARQGAQQLNQGMSELAAGAGALGRGMTELEEGTRGLSQGIQAAQSGLNALTGQSEGLRSGALELAGRLKELSQAIQNLPCVDGDAVQQAGKLRVASGEFLSSLQAASGQADQLPQSLAQLSQAMDASVGSLSQFIQGVDSLYNGQVNALMDSMNLTAEQKSAIRSLYASQMGTLRQVSQSLEQVNQQCANLAGQSHAAAGALAQLAGSYAQIDAGVGVLVDSVSAGSSESVGQLQAAVQALAQGSANLAEGVNAYTQGADQLSDQFKALPQGAAQLESGVEALKKGASGLCLGAKRLGSGSSQLASGMNDLLSGAGELTEGTGEMREETQDIDTELQQQVDDALTQYTGGNFEAHSFVSERNTRVSALQFVMRTAGIEVDSEQEAPAGTEADAAPQEQAAPEEAWWQKLMDLF